MEEVFCRNVRWFFKNSKYRKLGETRRHIDQNVRLRMSFEASLTSYRLITFQVYFLTSIGRPNWAKGPQHVLEFYNQNFGQPPLWMKKQFGEKCKKIRSISSWKGFFKVAKVPCPSDSELEKLLRDAVFASKRKKYH